MSDEHVKMVDWGRDHWSTLGYVECRCVDNDGLIANQHMRCIPSRHPLFAHTAWERDIPTRLAGGRELRNHDDWDCVDDMEAEGLVKNIGTGANRRYRMTDLGMMVCNALRNHKASGGSFSNFTYTPPEIAPSQEQVNSQ